jgi:hypothetical protein
MADGATELFKTDLALDVPLKDTLRFLIQFQTFQPDRCEGLAVSLFAFNTFPIGDRSLGHSTIILTDLRVLNQFFFNGFGCAACPHLNLGGTGC